MRVVHGTSSELEENLLHGGLLEVELGAIKGLYNLVHAEFCGPLLAGTPLVELGNEAIDTFSDLQCAFGESLALKGYSMRSITILRQSLLI